MKKLVLAALALAIVPASCQAPLRSAHAADTRHARNVLVVILLNSENGKALVFRRPYVCSCRLARAAGESPAEANGSSAGGGRKRNRFARHFFRGHAARHAKTS
jgi:hypothetical protein